MLERGVFLFFGAILSVPGAYSWGQTSPSPASGGAQMGSLPIQRIGAEELLNVSVYDAPELSRPVRVTSNGFVSIPMIGTIRAAGLLPAELENAITSALKTQGILVNPLVTVTILEYQSRPITIAGAVKSPLTFQAYGRVTLLDALGRAGGVTDNAGGEIFVSRATADSRNGNSTELLKVSLKQLMSHASQANIQLTAGDEVRVPEAEKIYVVGCVHKPGAFVVQDRSSASVLKMLALSEGLLPYHQKLAYIYRDEPGSGGKIEVPVELAKIMKRQVPDVILMPNDVLYVPENGVRRSWARAMDRVLTVTGAGVGTALIYK